MVRTRRRSGGQDWLAARLHRWATMCDPRDLIEMGGDDQQGVFLVADLLWLVTLPRTPLSTWSDPQVPEPDTQDAGADRPGSSCNHALRHCGPVLVAELLGGFHDGACGRT